MQPCLYLCIDDKRVQVSLNEIPNCMLHHVLCLETVCLAKITKIFHTPRLVEISLIGTLPTCNVFFPPNPYG